MDGDPSSVSHTRRRSTSVLPNGGHDTRKASISIKGSSLKHSIPFPDTEDADATATHEENGDSSRESGSDWEMDDMHSDEGLEDDEETGLANGDRSQRTKRKRRNTMLDERIVSTDAMIQAEEKAATQSVLQAAIINGILIALWYLFSISISVVSLSLLWTCYAVARTLTGSV